jgi:hypothetical protein
MWTRTEVTSPLVNGSQLVIRSSDAGLDPPKTSPKNFWNFDRVAIVAVKEGAGESDRFRVFGQSTSPDGACPTPFSASRLLARLYDYNATVLRLDHSPEFGNRRVDIYLCGQGKAGGEQSFGEDPYTPDYLGRPTKVNTVYIYDVFTLTDKLEACRELAHEYGHATLPPVKVAKAHEQWANGDLGERLYLSWLRDMAAKGALAPADYFDTTREALDRYYGRRVRPLVLGVAKNGPGLATLKKDDDHGFNGYLALACFARAVLPDEAFRRSLLLNPDQSPSGFAKAVLEVVNERPKVKIARPDGSLTEFWIPVGRGTPVGCDVLLKAGGWAKIRPTGPVFVKNVVRN